jgi:hypothetical protein
MSCEIPGTGLYSTTGPAATSRQAHYSYTWSAGRGCHRPDLWAGNDGHPSQVRHAFR